MHRHSQKFCIIQIEIIPMKSTMKKCRCYRLNRMHNNTNLNKMPTRPNLMI